MKKQLLLFLLLTATIITVGQQQENTYTLDFERAAPLKHLRIDTLTNKSNSWKIGSPHKKKFTSAVSQPNVIVTDTINSYPANNISSFIITNIAGMGFHYHYAVDLIGFYFVNSDTLTDYGKIEFSPNNGKTWIDLLNDTIHPSVWDEHFGNSKPILTGNSNGWTFFRGDILALADAYNLNITQGDTLLYRFTFISDAIQTNKDGLMFDDLRFDDFVTNISEIKNDNLILISPNPVTDKLKIHRIAPPSYNERIQLLDYTGKILIDNPYFTDEGIDVSALVNGVYLLRYTNDKNFTTKKIIIRHN